MHDDFVFFENVVVYFAYTKHMNIKVTKVFECTLVDL